MRKEILEWAARLMSALPSKLPSGFDIQLTLEAYVMACEGCGLVRDLQEAVERCIKGVPVLYEWAPQPAELGVLVRDARARRRGEVAPERPSLPPPGPAISDEAYKRMDEAAERAKKSMVVSVSHTDWVKDQIANGNITVKG